jgi:hypothetical protein
MHGELGRARAVHRGLTAVRTEGAGARWRIHRSIASGRSGAPKLTGGGAKEREEHGEFDSGLTGLELRRGDRATAVPRRGHGNSVGRGSGAGEEKRRAR